MADGPTVSVYLKGWRDSQRYSDAVNHDTDELHELAMPVHERSFEPWAPGDPAWLAVSFDVELLGPISIEDPVILEHCFELFNIGDPTREPVVRRYRNARARSLSVGDVIMINERAYTCASFGWERVDFDPTALPVDPTRASQS